MGWRDGCGGRPEPPDTPSCPSSRPGTLLPSETPRGAVPRSRRVSVLLRRPGGRPALPPGPGGPRAAAARAQRRVAAGAERRGPHEPGRGRAALAGRAQRAVPRALRLPLCARRAPQQPGGGAPRAGAPAALPTRAGAEHPTGRGEEDGPPASRRPPREPSRRVVAAAPASDPGRTS